MTWNGPQKGPKWVISGVFGPQIDRSEGSNHLSEQILDPGSTSMPIEMVQIWTIRWSGMVNLTLRSIDLGVKSSILSRSWIQDLLL